MTTTTRLVTVDDAGALADLLRTNRDFLAPWDPVRGESYFTEEGQVAVVHEVLAEYGRGAALPHVIVQNSDRIVGRITLTSIVRGSFQSCNLGYWVSEADNGRGVATAAVRALARVAFVELRLHRIEAGTLVSNIRSQRVLERNGFVQFGLARAYLQIGASWQDHAMYQLLNVNH